LISINIDIFIEKSAALVSWGQGRSTAASCPTVPCRERTY